MSHTLLHLWTIKSPSSRRLISHKGNGYQAIEIAKGVNNTNSLTAYHISILLQ
jgi:hypothetical protein